MPKERVTMRKTQEILRLVWFCNQSRRDTGRTCGVGKSTVNDTIHHATAASLTSGLYPLTLMIITEM